MLADNPGPMREDEYRTITLPGGSRRLSFRGTVTLHGQKDGKSVDFETHNGKIEYYTLKPKWPLERRTWLDENWCIFIW